MFRYKTLKMQISRNDRSYRVIKRLKSISADSDYQYIQRSIVPTMHFQKSLPRLPIPELSKTCDRYLLALKPLLDDGTYRKTTDVVRKFQTEEGISLHKELVDVDSRNKHTSYVSEPWFDMYLSDRTPLPVNYNPFLVYVNDKNATSNSQLIKSSNLIISSVRFYKSLRDNILEPEVYHLKRKKSDTQLFRRVTSLLPSAISWYGAFLFKAYPLDMVQYTNLFNSTRIPQFGKDKIYQNKGQKHIVVLRRGHFYVFDVLDENGNILSPETILSSVNYILKDNVSESDNPFGVLTTMNRDKWAECRQHLENIGNKEALNLIDGSLFAIALDDTSLENAHDIGRSYLHADGVNRWFDKSFTLIVGANGLSGINFEHSWGDGVAILRYFQDIYKDTTEKRWVYPDTNTINLNSNNKPKKLEFVVDEKIKTSINEAKSSYKSVYESLDVNDVTFDLGKRLCKQHKISPDAVIQLAFQLAYYQLTKKQTATYESCSTAAFKQGRTETVRPCTLQTKKFCEAVSSQNASKEELRNLIKGCSETHGELVKQAAMGQGFDRHLFALRTIAAKRNIHPKIFSDYGYKFINHNILSTSTLSSDVVLCGGFGPVVQDGYGISYMIKNDTCGTMITNYKNHSDGSSFKSCLENSLINIKSILSGN